ncbi:MAG: DUF167 domain-containing protein [Chlamydiota bacterium]
MRYEVHVKFHRNDLEIEGNIITIGISVSPEKGKANAEIIRKLAKHFKVPKSSIKIIIGTTSRKKIIEID